MADVGIKDMKINYSPCPYPKKAHTSLYLLYALVGQKFKKYVFKPVILN